MNIDTEVPIFTPDAGNGLRYVLYRHSPDGVSPGKFSISPLGPTFNATWERADCGSGCRCAAVLVKPSAKAKSMLRFAGMIDNASNVVRREM